MKMAELAAHEDRQVESEGIIFEIERWSTKDGPGIRTVVFFKGCPLRCKWCCNPESWSPVPQLATFKERCSECGRCQEVCPQNTALPAAEGGFKRRAACTACGRCVSACPAGAREIMGEKVSADEVLSAVEKDRVFYRQSGGGVTFTGGEPLFQSRFLREVVGRCWKRGISMALETCGVFQWENSQDLLTKMDLVFLDLKHMDEATHKRLTGASHQHILQNAARITGAHIPLVIRLPLIPSLNTDTKNLKATAAFMAEHLEGSLGVEILPYHPLGKGKYAPLGLDYALDDLDPPGPFAIERAKEIFRRHGVAVLDFGSNR